MSNNQSTPNQPEPQPPVQGPDVPAPAPGEPSKDPNVDGIWLHNDKGEPTTFFGIRYESSEASSDASSLPVGDSSWEPHRRSIGFPFVLLIGSIAAVLWGPNLLNRALQSSTSMCFPAIAYEENGEFILEIRATLPVGETYSVNPNGHEGFGKATVVGSGSGISWLDPEFPADATAGTTSWSVCNK